MYNARGKRTGGIGGTGWSNWPITRGACVFRFHNVLSRVSDNFDGSDTDSPSGARAARAEGEANAARESITFPSADEDGGAMVADNTG